MTKSQFLLERASPGVVPEETVILEELSLIRMRRKRLNLRRSEKNLVLSALSLSGGGVRSASFCLGVTKALAEFNILKNFDYLSTVSGGGFAGSFLTRWAHEVGCKKMQEDLTNDFSFSVAGPLLHLRKYVSYLTPKLGLTSLDSLAVAALYLRNLIINWIVIIPWLLAASLLPAVCKIILDDYFAQVNGKPPTIDTFVSIVSTLVGSTAVLVIWMNRKYRPDLKGQTPLRRSPDPIFSGLIELFVVPAFLVLLFISADMNRNSLGQIVVGFIGYAAPDGINKPHIFLSWLSANSKWVLLAVGAVVLVENTISQLIRQGAWTERDPKKPFRRMGQLASNIIRNQIAFFVQLLAMIFVVSLGQSLIGRFQTDYISGAIVVFLPLWIHFAYLLGDAFYIALQSRQPWIDIEQEWTARISGSLSSLPFAWTALAAVVIWGPLNFKENVHSPETFRPIIALGTTTTAIGLVGYAATRLTKLFEDAKKGLATWQALGAKVASGLALFLFLLCLLVLLSMLGALFSVKLATVLPDSIKSADPKLMATLILIFVPVLFSVVFDLCSNLNKFSLHGIYRNRLVRTFVGASNPDRARHKPGFLNILATDNIPLDDLRRHPQADSIPPSLHVVNLSMNIPGSTDVTYQERRALPFIATPLFVGTSALPLDTAGPKGWFRDTADYSNTSKRGAMQEKFSYGGAIAISGAAFDPSMGRFSTLPLRLLLTFFNLRLGVWLGNSGPPGSVTRTKFDIPPFRAKGPRFMALQIAKEFLGRANEAQKFVHLSDGGHFENLAAYEMLRRRCGFILIVDAGCDPECHFEDLGLLQRLARTDINAHIDFPAANLNALRDGTSAHAFGEVTYRDSGNQLVGCGTICYLKPRLTKGLQPETSAFASTNPKFPNEPTSNQFYSESQFFAYFRLGYDLGKAASEAIKKRKNDPALAGWF